MTSPAARSSTIRQLQSQLAASQKSGIRQKFFSTGCVDIDAMLPEHGLPTSALVEWISEDVGQSAASVALTLSRGLLSQPGCLTVIDPMFQFHAAALCSTGIELSRLLLIRPDADSGHVPVGSEQTSGRNRHRSSKHQSQHAWLKSLPPRQANALWALEQSARCPGVRLVLCWVDQVSSTVLRRLQLAVERSGTTVFLIRPDRVRRQPSWADLRIGVRAKGDTVQLQILKSRYPTSGRSLVSLAINHETGAVRPPAELANPATQS